MTRLELRPMSRDDLPTMSTWLAQPHVHAWWGDDPAPAALEQEYGPALDGTDPARLRIAMRGDDPIGFIQWYSMDDEPAYRRELATVADVLPGDMSLDYLIGSTTALGHGLGATIISLAAAEIWRDRADATRIVVPVHALNRASWRSLERAGFIRIAEGDLEPDFETDDHRHVVYATVRPYESE